MAEPLDYPPHPAIDKLAKVSDTSQAIGGFLEWLAEGKGIVLCTLHVHGGLIRESYYPINRSIEDLLAEFYGIDLRAVDAEKVAILEWVRANNALNGIG